MDHNGDHGLGQEAKVSKATSGQGDSKNIARLAFLNVAEGTMEQNDEDSFIEPPNESSLLSLDTPVLEPTRWGPHDQMRLLVVAGIFLLIALSMVIKSDVTAQLIAVLSLIAGYFFGRIGAGRR